MRIESGHLMMNDVAEVAGDSVRFVCDDGRTMFEVRIRKDGRSLEVRGVDTAIVNGVLYGTASYGMAARDQQRHGCGHSIRCGLTPELSRAA
jgi:hypothetical protein